MNSFCRANHGQRYCSWARTHADDGVAQDGGHNRNEANFFFVGSLWLGPIDSGVDEISSKNEREREE